MKKLLVLILACLSCTVMFAQGQLHYPINNQGVGAMFTKLNGVLVIDGVEQASSDLEIGVFDQDGICRGAKRGMQFPMTGKFVYLLQIRGNEGFTYTFRVYDHATETELEDLIDNVADDNGDPIIYQGNYTYQHNGTNTSAANPMPLNFSTSGGGYTLPITGYGESTTDHWYLIATPISQVSPASVEGMVCSDNSFGFDLFSYDQSATLQWVSYKEHSDFVLTAGTGYLYANENDVTLTFSGEEYVGEGDIDLVYGWNLIGNPFGMNAMLDMPFYRMNEEGNAFVGFDPGEVSVMEGVLVGAETAGLTATFSEITGKGNNIAKANLFVSNENGKVVDKAILHFDEGATLRKLQFRENSTKLYIPQSGNDYAIANVQGDEMPLNFKAETTGLYTISFKLEDATVGYLHLFDKATGNDVDLLANNEYSFIGSPRDAEDRFIVRFSEMAANDSFVYQSGDELIVIGEGTLQVFDVMGRFVGSYNVNGNMSINASQFSNAVYVFRMIGDDIKTQKIVVR